MIVQRLSDGNYRNKATGKIADSVTGLQDVDTNILIQKGAELIKNIRKVDKYIVKKFPGHGGSLMNAWLILDSAMRGKGKDVIRKKTGAILSILDKSEKNTKGYLKDPLYSKAAQRAITEIAKLKTEVKNFDRLLSQ